jgi:hypothetical protein
MSDTTEQQKTLLYEVNRSLYHALLAEDFKSFREAVEQGGNLNAMFVNHELDTRKKGYDLAFSSKSAEIIEYTKQVHAFEKHSKELHKLLEMMVSAKREGMDEKPEDKARVMLLLKDFPLSIDARPPFGISARELIKQLQDAEISGLIAPQAGDKSVGKLEDKPVDNSVDNISPTPEGAPSSVKKQETTAIISSKGNTIETDEYGSVLEAPPAPDNAPKPQTAPQEDLKPIILYQDLLGKINPVIIGANGKEINLNDKLSHTVCAPDGLGWLDEQGMVNFQGNFSDAIEELDALGQRVGRVIVKNGQPETVEGKPSFSVNGTFWSEE